MKRRKLLIEAGAVVALIAAGCAAPATNTSAPSGNSTTAAPAAANAPARSGGELIIAQSTEPQSLDPQLDAGGPSSSVQDNVLEGLVSADENMKIVPALATNWDISPDGKTYTFHLRQGVKFSDGTDMNADAVKFTFDRALGKIDGKKNRYVDLISDLESVDSVDPSTVRFNLKNQDAALLNALAHNGFAIQSPTAFQKLGDQYKRSPVGTGPFMVQEWNQGQSVTLVKNPNYWQPGLPKLDKVTIKFIPDAQTREVSLETGSVDMAFDLPEQAVPQLKTNPKFQVIAADSLRTVFLRFNPDMAPFDDMAVRQAFIQAVDVNQIASTILEGLHRPATAPTFAPAVHGVSGTVPPYTYDVQAAKTLLDQAGWVPGPDGVRVKDGKPLAFPLWTTTDRYPKDSEIAQYIAQALKPLGMKADVQTMEWGAYRDAIFAKKFPVFLFGAGDSTGDADYVISLLFYSTSQYAQGKIPDEEQILQARAETDETRRLAMYDRIEKTIRDQYVFLPLYWQSILLASSDKVQGYVAHPDESIHFAQVTVNK